MPSGVRIGAIVEIPTARGLAYVQATHKHDEWGYVIRALSGFRAERPASFDTLVQEDERFVTFFPLGSAVNRKIFAMAGHAEVPARASAFPLFRCAG